MTPNLAHILDSLANEFQYAPSGRWGVETVGPIREAAGIIAVLEKQQTTQAFPTNEQRAKLRKVLQHHNLTVVGDGVVEADIIAALKTIDAIQPPKCACCGTAENLHRDYGSGGPYRCNSPDCMVF